MYVLYLTVSALSLHYPNAKKDRERFNLPASE